MNRTEAQALIGTKVHAWTAANGQYVGILEQVIGSPWRGTVRITGVLKPACVYDMTRPYPRKGFRPGQTIEVGGRNITPSEAIGLTYLEALRGELAILEDLASRPHNKHRSMAWLPLAVTKVRQVIADEERTATHD